jgi:twinkle protein
MEFTGSVSFPSPHHWSWNPGFPEWENKIMLAARMLSVVTGNPGHGKTALWGQIWFNIVRPYCVPMFVASFETRPKPHLRRQFRTLYCGALDKDLTAKEIADADEWINASYLFAVHPDGRPTLEWLLDKAEVAVIRHGARIVQVDPWNRLEGARGQGENETDYIGRCLRTLHAFANDLSCHVQILAHPAKVDFTRRGFAPSLEDISGSKHWDNMPDQGFVVPALARRVRNLIPSRTNPESYFIEKDAIFRELQRIAKIGTPESRRVPDRRISRSGAELS